MSKTRKRYILRLIGRCMVLLACALAAVFCPETFAILDGSGFFKGFSVLHLLWLVWVADMVLQIIPIKNQVPPGVPEAVGQPLPPHQG